MKFTPWILGAFIALGAHAEDRAALDHFESSVRPLFAARCESCHGAEKQTGALRLDSREGWGAGGSRGAAIVPGNPAESLLLHAVRRGDPDLQMPPETVALRGRKSAVWLREEVLRRPAPLRRVPQGRAAQ